jgi:N-acyl-D-aspartate/D-glutamate deacylase
MTAHYNIIIQNGLVFDGQGHPPLLADIGIKNNHIEIIASAMSLNITHADTIIDAHGKWVCPGFIDLHTHYDAEVMVSPGLTESIRHGITTCFVGSCSLSTIYSSPEDVSDIFTRVESVPREYVLPALEKMKTWSDSTGYINFLNNLPLGPNIACYVGHSDLRAGVMGLGRSVNPKLRPSSKELGKMKWLLNQAIDDGFLGLSSMTNPWDKVDGDRFRSAKLPSAYAKWKEYRALHKILRKRNAILQSAPNLVTKINAIFFLFTSSGFGFRKKLRTTLITLIDTKADPFLSRIADFGASFFNKVLGADFRWQALPVPFTVYADGMDFIIFEEFPAGEAILHLQDNFDRIKLFKDSHYRRQFKKQYKQRWGARVWHRDFGDAYIISCPDKSLEGKHIKLVAEERGQDESDTFLDLMIDYGEKLRWRTTIGNHQPRRLLKNVVSSSALIGFSDAGAHLRNMAFYNAHLNVLKMSLNGKNNMSAEYAVWRISGEIANWHNIDAGHLAEGKRADIAIIDPKHLAKTDLLGYYESQVKEFGNLSRIVNRNPGVVTHTIINGEVAFQNDQFHLELGKEKIFGKFLKKRPPKK